MNFLNPAVTEGVDLFVNITIILIGFVTAISLIDAKRSAEKDKKK
jgi:nucleoside permease NupC